MPSSTDYYAGFDPIEHGLEEGIAYLDRLLEWDTLFGIWYSDAESARDNLGVALTKYKEKA